MPQTARAIFEEYLDMGDGDAERALWYACHAIVWLENQRAYYRKHSSGGFLREGRNGKSTVRAPMPTIDDNEAWLETGKES